MRNYPGADVEELKAATEAAPGMRAYGLNLPPTALRLLGPNNYVITSRVSGRPLEDLLKFDPSDELTASVDTLYETVGRYLLAESLRGQNTVLASPYIIGSYTLGALLGQTAEKLWLTEPPEFIADEPTDYSFNIELLVDGILGAERLTETQLPNARRMAEAAINLVPTIVPSYRATVDKANRALRTDTPMGHNE